MIYDNRDLMIIVLSELFSYRTHDMVDIVTIVFSLCYGMFCDYTDCISCTKCLLRLTNHSYIFSQATFLTWVLNLDGALLFFLLITGRSASAVLLTWGLASWEPEKSFIFSIKLILQEHKMWIILRFNHFRRCQTTIAMIYDTSSRFFFDIKFSHTLRVDLLLMMSTSPLFLYPWILLDSVLVWDLLQWEALHF